MGRFLQYVLQVVFTLVVLVSPVGLLGLAIHCFVEHKIILGIVLSVVLALCLGILTYDW